MFGRRQINHIAHWAIGERRALSKRSRRNRSRFHRLLGECLEDRRPLAVMTIAAANADRPEGNTGSTSFTFEVSRVGDTSGSATVDYFVTGSGANPANVDDFNGNTLPSGQVLFFAGQTSKTITINVTGDRIVESDETFTVNLTNPSSGSSIGNGTAGGTIRDDDAPPPTTLAIAATNADREEGNSGSTPFTFTVVRSGDTSGATTVDYTVTGSGSSPANVDDFNGNVLPSGQVTFFSGQTSKTITINVSGDFNIEDNETFTVTLSNPSGQAVIETASATGTIRDDDTPPTPSLAIVATNADRDEGNSGVTPFTFTVTRSGDTSGGTTVDYVVSGSGSNPASASDFNGGILPTGQVTFFAGQTSKTITINVAGDVSVESDETFTVTLSNPSGGATIATGSATGMIRNDDQIAPPTLAISATNADRNEGNSGTTNFTFTVTRSGSTAGAVSATYTVVGSGTNPASASDFVGGSLPSASVVFAAGETTRTISIPVSGDVIQEQDETFLVVLSNPTGGATISTASATGTIRNDDAAPVPSLSIAPAAADQAEGNTGTTFFTFNVTRGGVTSGIVIVNYTVSGTGSNQANASDFVGGVFPSGSVQFNDGETSKTVQIPVRGDVTVEADESFLVTLSNPTGGAVISNATATGIIRDDDTPPVPILSIAASNADRSEGNTGTTPFTFTVTRTGDTSSSVSVDFTVIGSGSAPATASDFNGNTFPGGQVIFFSGQTSKTITIQVTGDFTVENDEEFTVTLSNPTNGATIANASAKGIIRDDDNTPSSTLSIAATNADRNEGNSGVTNYTFTVTRAGNTSGAASVSYAVTGTGTSPANAADFAGGVFPSGTVNFLSGETTKSISIPVVGDSLKEPDESFVVTLSNASSNTVIQNGNATGVIRNDDVSEYRVNIVQPTSVAQTQTIPASTNPTAIIFRAVSNTTLSVSPINFTPPADSMQIVDSTTNPIGSQNGATVTASLISGQTYAIVLPSQTTQRTYSVTSSAGSAALSINASTNIFLPTDTTADGFVTALDALVIINRLNLLSSGGTPSNSGPRFYYLDVNASGLVTELDALIVINRLNRDDAMATQPTAEPEPVAPLANFASTAQPTKTFQEEWVVDELLAASKFVQMPGPAVAEIADAVIFPSEVPQADEYDLALDELLRQSDSTIDLLQHHG
ncbi:Calx-beta domain-containing protein [Aporhodopirellula aestuarii]|uniref:Dockerin type I domain-containing protein n=1 Tax=Aporhodopirellula aestuarii TaxID=2950107 RepID=A0ABT0TZU7_9BACT|nr:Calx-beta domain-containing protein [Aporhodopirellula aestuarii]MCM2370139.1 dockerin type I domain-containing protein [Aporhodopirellula aestuarii]